VNLPFALPSDSSAHPMATTIQVLFDLHIAHHPCLAGECEIQQSTSPLWFLQSLVKKPSMLSRDLQDAGPDNVRLPPVCRGHLPLALPDQEARNRHCWSPLFATSICSDLAALPTPSRAQCTLTLPCLLAHPLQRLSIPLVLQSSCGSHLTLSLSYKQNFRPATVLTFLAQLLLVISLV